jgi:DNA-binding response OmpR family regulator
VGATGPILIVEDDKNIASLVQTYLEREGFPTVTAHDGEQALRLERQCRPRFIILDLMLPRLDGWAVCKEIRSHSTCPS